MTVPSTYEPAIYTGNGAVDTYAYPFKIFAETDLVVTRVTIATGVAVTLDLTTDYTVTGVGDDDGGDIVLVDGNLAATHKIVIQRVLPLEQEVEYVPNDPFPAAVHQEVVDRQIMIDQQLQEQINRCIKVPVSETASEDDDVMSALNEATASAQTNADAAEDAKIAALAAQAAAEAAAASVPTMATILAALFPIGSIYSNGAVSTNPATLFGFGTWVAYAAGKTVFGLDAGGDADFNGLADTGGAKTVTLAKGNIPAHVHTYTLNVAPGAADSGGALDTTSTANTGDGTADGLKVSPDPVNILNPYVVAAMWRRTA